MTGISRASSPSPGGLCPSCSNVATCTYEKGPARPIVFCEEFERAPSPEPKEIAALSLGGEPADKSESPVFAGLCRNCENRGSCPSTGLPGGVWHCEDYD